MKRKYRIDRYLYETCLNSGKTPLPHVVRIATQEVVAATGCAAATVPNTLWRLQDLGVLEVLEKGDRGNPCWTVRFIDYPAIHYGVNEPAMRIYRFLKRNGYLRGRKVVLPPHMTSITKLMSVMRDAGISISNDAHLYVLLSRLRKAGLIDNQNTYRS